MKWKVITLIVFSHFFFTFSLLNAQEYGNLLGQLDTNRVEQPMSTFKSSRLNLGQSTVQLSKGELQFKVSHLFDRISDGIDELYGLDQMHNPISLSYFGSLNIRSRDYIDDRPFKA